ncbi:unnamed protein product [Leptidea sinapis]|uniref:Uncharacterized protein n=1 Tax=Leptidea sinapis TaxID=189913 RepID=A0A5E4Q5J9_9NEOP|nr:unnamed protein product [Leptidea sinapis]
MQVEETVSIKEDPSENNENDENVKLVIKNVFSRCKLEKDNGNLVFPLDKCIERTSFYAGIAKSTIYRDCHNIITEELPVFDINQYVVIMRAVNSILLNSKLGPSMNCTNYYMEYINQCKIIALPNVSLKSFSDLLVSLGFIYKLDSVGKLFLIERPIQIFTRFHYLSKVLKYRNMKDKQFYYIDERYIDDKCNFKKCWLQNAKNNPKPHDVFHCMVSSKKYECGFISSQICILDFKRWLLELALPKIQPESIIIMDENCYNNLSEEDEITEYHSKEEMMKYLKNNDIPYTENMRKAEIFELINKCVPQKQKYSNLYNNFKAHGHVLLCLPSKLSGLTLTELLWDHVKTMMTPNDTLNIKTIRHAVYKYLSTLPQKTFTELETKLIEMENEIFAMDATVEDYLEKEVNMVNSCDDF